MASVPARGTRAWNRLALPEVCGIAVVTGHFPESQSQRYAAAAQQLVVELPEGERASKLLEACTQYLQELELGRLILQHRGGLGQHAPDLHALRLERGHPGHGIVQVGDCLS